jgi:hypothetical protein
MYVKGWCHWELLYVYFFWERWLCFFNSSTWPDEYNSLFSKPQILLLIRLFFIEACRTLTSSQIHSPWLGDTEMTPAYGLSYRLASLRSLAGWLVRKPYTRVDFNPPVRDYEFGYRFPRRWFSVSLSIEVKPIIIWRTRWSYVKLYTRKNNFFC